MDFIHEESDKNQYHRSKRMHLVSTFENKLRKAKVKFKAPDYKTTEKDFYDNSSILRRNELVYELRGNYEEDKLCSWLNKELMSADSYIKGHVKRGSKNELILIYDESSIIEPTNDLDLTAVQEDFKSVIKDIKKKLSHKKIKSITKDKASKEWEIPSDDEIKEIKNNIKNICNESIKYFNLSMDKIFVSRKWKYYLINSLDEQYVYDIENDYVTIVINQPPIIAIAEANIPKKELNGVYDEIKNIRDKINNEYIKSIKCKFNIHATAEKINAGSFFEIILNISYSKKLKRKETIKESETLELPNAVSINLQTLLDNTDLKHIYFTSDWHLLKNRYKHERNDVNTKEIVSWCKQNIKDDDIFMYLGDISYRWLDEAGKKESMEIMSSLPGIKVLIAGNHDRVLGDDYLRGCGFDYIFDEYTWNNLVFTHKPINMDLYPDEYWNIHGHIHKWTGYNTTDGKKNINVYPYWFDNKPVTLDYILKHKEKLVKDNHWNPNDILSETKRSELPDDAFGIPEDRKYPLDTEQHVKSAIKLFGHAEESKKKKLAQNIRSAAKKYDITIPENTQCYKYLNEGGIESIIPEEVNNIVFDMGSVLVNHNTLKALNEGLFAKDYVAHKIDDFLHDEIFSMENKDVDLWSTEEMKRYTQDIAPEFVLKHLDKIFEVIPKAMYKYQYTDELLSVLRDKGYNLYYLSNWPKWSYTLEEEFFAPLISKFDGGLFSFESEQFMKPDQEFYKEFFDKFNLDPDTCFFFDDKAENVNAGECLGMRGIIFNDEETPKILLQDIINIPSDVNNTILIDMGAKLESVSLDKIDWWYLSSEKNNNCPNKELYYKSLSDALAAIPEEDLADGPIEKYVFTCNGHTGNLDCIPIGQILINPDLGCEWLIQYPVEFKDGLYQTVLNEWSMAACNPICGVSKPFILKVSNDTGSLLSPAQYAFSPDLISDKYLVINENAQLEIVDSSRFKDCFVEVYEFIGNKAYINKLNEAYNKGKIVDNTVFYTMLTGKPMLCEDQIDYDPSFRKVNFEYLKEDMLAKLATVRDGILKNNKEYECLWTPITESAKINAEIPFINKYNKYGNISVKEDFDGYYFYSSMTEKRSSSVKELSLMNEAMIKSVL